MFVLIAHNDLCTKNHYWFCFQWITTKREYIVYYLYLRYDIRRTAALKTLFVSFCLYLFVWYLLVSLTAFLFMTLLEAKIRRKQKDNTAWAFAIAYEIKTVVLSLFILAFKNWSKFEFFVFISIYWKNSAIAKPCGVVLMQNHALFFY